MTTPSHTPRRVIHLRLRVGQAKIETLLSLLREAVPFYEEPGGIRIRLLRSLHEPTRFIEVVEYSDDEAYAKDEVRLSSDERMKTFLDRWRAILDEHAEVEEYEDVTERLSAGNGGDP